MRLANSRTKCRARIGISSLRSRNDGTRIGKMFNRKNRSERNVRFLHLGGEVTIGGGDHSGIDANRLRAAHALELLLLQHPQQLHLGLERQLPDFVQENRAAVGQLEAALLLLHRTGERPALMSKELALDQCGRQSAAIHLDHDRGLASAGAMQRACNQLLTCPGVAEQQHRRIGVGDELDRLEDLLHRRRCVRGSRRSGGRSRTLRAGRRSDARARPRAFGP